MAAGRPASGTFGTSKYVDPVLLQPGIGILRDAIKCFADASTHARIHAQMDEVPNFVDYFAEVIGVEVAADRPRVDHVLLIEIFYSFLLSHNLACLKSAHMVAVLRALADAPIDVLEDCYEPTLIAIVTLVDTFIRVQHKYGTPLEGYELPSVLPLDVIVKEFTATFGPILASHIDDAFEDIFRENKQYYEEADKDQRLFRLMHTQPAKRSTYDTYYKHIADIGFGSTNEHIAHAVEISPRVDHMRVVYERILAVCTNDVKYQQLIDECELKKRVIKMINNTLRQFRDAINRSAIQVSPRPSAKGKFRPVSMPADMAAAATNITTLNGIGIIGSKFLALPPMMRSPIRTFL